MKANCILLYSAPCCGTVSSAAGEAAATNPAYFLPTTRRAARQTGSASTGMSGQLQPLRAELSLAGAGKFGKRRIVDKIQG